VGVLQGELGGDATTKLIRAEALHSNQRPDDGGSTPGMESWNPRPRAGESPETDMCVTY